MFVLGMFIAMFAFVGALVTVITAERLREYITATMLAIVCVGGVLLITYDVNSPVIEVKVSETLTNRVDAFGNLYEFDRIKKVTIYGEEAARKGAIYGDESFTRMTVESWVEQ